MLTKTTSLHHSNERRHAPINKCSIYNVNNFNSYALIFAFTITEPFISPSEFKSYVLCRIPWLVIFQLLSFGLFRFDVEYFVWILVRSFYSGCPKIDIKSWEPKRKERKRENEWLHLLPTEVKWQSLVYDSYCTNQSDAASFYIWNWRIQTA